MQFVWEWIPDSLVKKYLKASNFYYSIEVATLNQGQLFSDFSLTYFSCLDKL